MEVLLAKENKPEEIEMRQAYGEALRDMMDQNMPVMPMDADLMRAIGLLPYRDQYPDNIVDCGIAEANMFGVAAGLSAEGFIPFPHTFGVFASRRGCDQVFMSGAYAKQNVKVVGSDPGVLAGLNGGTHQALEDVAIMRAIPGMTIIEPTDAVMTKELTYLAAKTYGMFYIRLFRSKAVKIYEEGTKFQIGKAVKVKDGTDVTVIAAGTEVAEAIKASEIMKEKGVSVRVYDMFTIKPLDKEAVLEAAEETGAIVTAENHNIIGGLGSAVAEVLAENYPVPLERIGVKDTFGEVGPADWLKEQFELKAEDIAKKIEKVLERK